MRARKNHLILEILIQKMLQIDFDALLSLFPHHPIGVCSYVRLVGYMYVDLDSTHWFQQYSISNPSLMSKDKLTKLARKENPEQFTEYQKN